MADRDAIRSRVEAKVARGEFLAQMLRMVHGPSSETQDDFVAQLASVGATVRELLENNGLIKAIDYRPTTFWPSLKGNRYCFIDGGVANIELPSAAPLGIRVGTYMVRPGHEGSDRESFDVALSLVDELFSQDAWFYGDGFEDIAKLRDAARIIAETSAAHHVCKKHGDVTAVFMHGPLVNPVSPYGLSDFPAFSQDAYNLLIGEEETDTNEDERQFVSTYLRLLNALLECSAPVLGVVERSMGRSTLVFDACTQLLLDRRVLTPASYRKIYEEVRSYQLNDERLFDVVLNVGEYVEPVPVNRQGPENKWPDFWKGEIRSYPWPLSSYLKPSEDSEPFRVEALPETPSLDLNMAVLFHTSRLLPTYGFPVGLDIVDKYAKVPAWMSRSVRGQHAVVLMKQALASGDPKVLAFAKRVLAARGRDWLFRPTA